jgi:hypothetical protein
MRKIKKDIAGNPLFSIEKAEPDNLKRKFNDLVKLHQRRWNNKGLPGLFSNKEYHDFLEEVTYAFAKKRYLYLSAAYSNSECISVQYAFKYKNKYYDYLKAFDDKSRLSKYRPGKALLLLLIEEAIGNNYNTVDLLRGSEQYKYEIANEYDWVNSVRINNPVNKIYFRYKCFLLLMICIYIKHSVTKEINVIRAQIKNYGIACFTHHYIPDALARIKNKIAHSPMPTLKKDMKSIHKEKTILKKELSEGSVISVKEKNPVIEKKIGELN